MPQYRKIGSRKYFKLTDQGNVMLIINKEKWSEIHFGENGFLNEDVFGKIPEIITTSCTEQEFNEAKSIAVTRIGLERIEQ